MNTEYNIKQLFKDYATAILQLKHYIGFWFRYIDDSSKIYSKLDIHEEESISSSVFTASNIDNDGQWQLLTSDIYFDLEKKNINSMATQFKSFISKYVLIQAHLLMEKYLLGLIWDTKFKELDYPTNGKKISQLKYAVKNFMKQNEINFDQKNNNFLSVFIMNSYSKEVNNFMEFRVSPEHDFTYKHLLELITKMRHLNAHNIEIEISVYQNFTSNDVTKSFIASVFKVEPIKDSNKYYELTINENHLHIFIDSMNNMIVNITKLVYLEQNFKFIGMRNIESGEL